MPKYGVFESTNMKSTIKGGAARIMDAVATEPIENGTFGYLEGTPADDSNVYIFKKGWKDGEPVFVVDQPVWSPDDSLTSNQRKDKFIIPENTRFRVREVAVLDSFGINDSCVTAGTRSLLAKGVYLSIDDTSGKLIADTTEPTATPIVARIENVRIQGAVLTTPVREYGYSDKIYECIVRSVTPQ